MSNTEKHDPKKIDTELANRIEHLERMDEDSYQHIGRKLLVVYYEGCKRLTRVSA